MRLDTFTFDLRINVVHSSSIINYVNQYLQLGYNYYLINQLADNKVMSNNLDLSDLLKSIFCPILQKK